MTKRYLTETLPGIGGMIKSRVEDFVVEELPLYPPSGEGEHTFFEIEKTGIPTFQAVREVARALHLSPNQIGYAGLKDAQAITSQILSVHGISPDVVSALDLPKIRVNWAERHRNKLKIGHLRGNRFTIRIREVDESALSICGSVLDMLGAQGVPNFFGPQRFGKRGDSARLGRAVVLRREEDFVRAFLGEPRAEESDWVQAARAQFEAGQWEAARDSLPRSMADERGVLQMLIRTSGNYRQAYAAVPKRLKKFLLSAYQSALFNRVLRARMPELDRIYTGDLAMKHPGRSVFRVTDEAVEQPRVLRFEISPTGPVFGYKMMQPLGHPGRLEESVLADEGLTLEDFRVGDGIRLRGERRALRFQMYDAEIWYDDGIMLRFWLPRGCYATAVLAEVMKEPAPSTVSEVTKL